MFDMLQRVLTAFRHVGPEIIRNKLPKVHWPSETVHGMVSALVSVKKMDAFSKMYQFLRLRLLVSYLILLRITYEILRYNTLDCNMLDCISCNTLYLSVYYIISHVLHIALILIPIPDYNISNSFQFFSVYLSYINTG